MKPLIYNGTPPYGLTALRTDEMPYIGLNHDSAYFFGMVSNIVSRVDLLPAFRAKETFGVRHVSIPFDKGKKGDVPQSPP